MKKTLFFILTLIIYSHCFSQSKTILELDLWATYYYVPTIQHDENGIDLLNIDEEKTGLKINPCDWCNASIQGTLIIKKGKTFVLNYAGRSKTLQYDCRECTRYKNYDGYLKTGKVLWTYSSGFGKGVKDYNLVPFKSIAVDSSKIPYGSVVYIPDAKGISYTDTDGTLKKHDGYFFASDTGSKITGNHIDIFIGTETDNPFTFAKSNKDNTFTAYIIENKSIKTILENLHK